MKEKFGSYTKVYDFMLFDFKLAKYDLLVYAYIFSLTIVGGSYYGSQSKLAERFGTSRKTINDVLKKLTEDGYLIKEDVITDKGKCCIYTVDMDKLPDRFV